MDKIAKKTGEKKEKKILGEKKMKLQESAIN